MKKVVLILGCLLLYVASVKGQTVTITPEHTVSCATTTVIYKANLSADFPTGTYTYTWLVNNQNCSGCIVPTAGYFILPTGSHNSGDMVRCTVSVSGGGSYSGTTNVAYSTSIPLLVNLSIEPFVPSGSYCSDEVVFKAMSNSTAATFTWYKNGLSTGTGSTYDPISLYHGDVVRVVASTTEQCIYTSSAAQVETTIGGSGFYKIDQPVGNLTLHEQQNSTKRCQGSGTSVFYAQAANVQQVSWVIIPSSAGSVTASGSESNVGTVSWNPNFSGTASIKATAVGCVDQKVSTMSFLVIPEPVYANSTLTYCDFEPIRLKLPTSSGIETFNWYDSDNNFLGTGEVVQPSKSEGSYLYYTEPVNKDGCKSAAKYMVTVNIASDCDEKLNYIESIGYDDLGEVSHSKSYFDDAGKLLQSQTKILTADQVVTSQSVKDKLGRAAVSTLTAPINRSDFQYKHRFITDPEGGTYNQEDINLPVDNADPGTVGWYYSNNNTGADRERTPKTGYPFSQVEYYSDGSSEVRKNANPGEVHRLGMKHELISGTFPVNAELDDYMRRRGINTVNFVNGSFQGEITPTGMTSGLLPWETFTPSGETNLASFVWIQEGGVLSGVGQSNAPNTQYLGQKRNNGQKWPAGTYIVKVRASNLSTGGVEPLMSQLFIGSSNAPLNTITNLNLQGDSGLPVGNENVDITVSFTISQETDYLLFSFKKQGTTTGYAAKIHFKDISIVSINGVLQFSRLQKNNGVQTVVRDENGIYSIAINDKGGNGVMTAHAGNPDSYALKVDNNVTLIGDPSATGYYPMHYFYLLTDQVVSITGSSEYVVEDIVNDIVKAPGEPFKDPNEKWPAGFYRIRLVSSSPFIQVKVSYVNYFQDVAYQFYDDKGRLTSSISPNGFHQLTQSVPEDDIDKSTYKYNFRGWLTESYERDGGITKFLYRQDGKIRFAQDAQQAIDNTFSYTNYDHNGRPVEFGQYRLKAQEEFNDLNTSERLQALGDAWMWQAQKTGWTKTSYDFEEGYFDEDYRFENETHIPLSQTFVKGTVSKTQNENIQTWYSYDELGRVTWIAQRPELLHRVFVAEYSYDFLGNVITIASKAYDLAGVKVSEFYHHYNYDADKRLWKTYTSSKVDGEKKLRATYEYYLHGPLKRIELGDKLQGIDFVYNIRGWLTQINHPKAENDPGHDGEEGSGVNKDVFGMILNYYESEFTDMFKVSAITPRQNDPGDPFTTPIPSSIAEFIRPAFLTSTDVLNQVSQHSPSVYSAAKPLFREILNHYMNENDISLKGYLADESGSREYSATSDNKTAVASIDRNAPGLSVVPPSADRRFLIDLSDPNATKVLPGWNILKSGLTGAALNSLLDTNGETSSIRFEITKNASNGWGNGNFYNSEGYDGDVGDYPAAACLDSYFASGTGGVYSLKGLDPAKYYTIKIFGSRQSETTYNRIGAYTINGTMRTLGAAKNNDKFVYFYNLRPSASVEIVMNFGVAAGSQLGYINVLDIVQKDAPGIVGPGTSLSAAVMLRKGELSWTDNASNETGYHIERRKLGESAFQVIADVAANVNTFSDATVALGYSYEYRINAFNTTEESTYSNVAAIEVTGVVDRRFLVDFGNPAFETTGWNNMPSGLTGSVLTDLVNTSGGTSPIDIEVLQDASVTFVGDGVYYNTVGFNGTLGDYPQRACIDSYFSHGNGGSYKLKGLDPNKLYTVTIFGSRTGVSKNDRRGAFTINGIRKVLDASNNTSRTITFYHMVPTINGEIKIDFGVDAGAFLGYMNVWDILEVTNPVVETPASLAAAATINGVSLTWTDVATNETGYRIERKLLSESLFKQVAEIGAGTSQYTDNTTMSGTQYQYRLSAAYGDVNSAYSSIANVTTTGNPPDRRYLIDFGSPSFKTELPGWNNFTSSTAGYTLPNLVDANGNGSLVGLQMVTIASNGYGNGDVFNTNGSDVDNATLGYPATACKDSYFSYLTGGTFKLTGLNNSRYYSIKIFGSRTASDARKGTFTINGKQYTLETANNTAQTITLYNIVPNEAREIQLLFGVGSGSTLGYMGVMDITETSTPVVQGPTNLAVLVDGRFANLSWVDNASNEVGFKIERRASTESVYSVVGTVGPNATQFSDGLLASGTTYEYRVASYLSPEVLSTYTNSATVSIAGVPSRRFLMDLGDPGSTFITTTTGWNNMTGATTGSLLSNMIDTKGGTSTISFEIVKDASNGYGIPYNSIGSTAALGDYPLSATKDSYYANGSGGTYKLKGLNPSYYYTVTIFGSRQAPPGDLTKIGTYVINGEKKTLNGANNTTNTITFKQVQPNKVGEIVFDFGVEAGSQFGYFGVLDFTENSVPDLNPPALLSTQKLAGSSGVKLTWSDNTTYESSYEIYRATSLTGIYAAAGTTAANVTTFTDATANQNVVYYYRVRAIGSAGVSPYSNTLISDNSVDPPVLQTIANQVVNTSGTKEIILSAAPGGGVAADRKNIVILGSSTAEGYGSSPNTSPYPNSWASTFKNWLATSYTSGWNVINLGYRGYNSNELIADAERNMAKALTYNPVMVIINLPSNDVEEGVPDATFIANLTAMKQQAEAAGAKVLITTTQPRNNLNASQLARLQALASTIVSTFGNSAVEIYSLLADPSTLTIKTAYNADNIHVNNAGHALIYQAVKAKAEFLLNKAVLEFTMTNAPSFVKVTPIGNGQATLVITPKAGQTGNYSSITISAVDKNGNYGNQTFSISVDETDGSPVAGYRVKPLYNGIITATAWRTDSPEEGVTLMSRLESGNTLTGMYLYEYDDKYQFLNANWAQPEFGTLSSTFTMKDQMYRVTGLEYDPNGNIQALHRYDENGIRSNQFAYTYKPNTNQLTDVTGYTMPGGTSNHGFTYNAIGQMTEEYMVDGTNQLVDYDVAGRVVAVYSNTREEANLKVKYLYDDRGFRLAKISFPLGGSNETTRTTWYIRDVVGNILGVYEQDGAPTTSNADLITLTEIPVYGYGKLGTYYPVQDGSMAYEITDHLGNVRAVVRENISTYIATMEDNGNSNPEDDTNPRNREEKWFIDLGNTRVTDSHMNHTNVVAGVSEPDKASYLNGSIDPIGPAIALKVNAGDKIDIETWARFKINTDYTQNTTLLAFSQLMGGAFGGAAGFDGLTLAQTTSKLEGALAGLINGSPADPDLPEVFLNYVLFDSDMTYKGGFRVQASDAAGFEAGQEMLYDQHGTPIYEDVGFEHLTFDAPIEIAEAGYIYIWASNTSEGTMAWVDDLTVNHIGYNVSQATDYGVWGDVLRGKKLDDNSYRFGYQGQFSEKDEETQWAHFELRELDVVIGRWLIPDPFRQYYSPYVVIGNNTVNGVDPSGGKGEPVAKKPSDRVLYATIASCPPVVVTPDPTTVFFEDVGYAFVVMYRPEVYANWQAKYSFTDANGLKWSVPFNGGGFNLTMDGVGTGDLDYKSSYVGYSVDDLAELRWYPLDGQTIGEDGNARVLVTMKQVGRGPIKAKLQAEIMAREKGSMTGGVRLQGEVKVVGPVSVEGTVGVRFQLLPVMLAFLRIT